MTDENQELDELKPSKYKLSKENAKAEVDDFYEFFGEDADDCDEQLERIHRKMIGAVRRGTLEFEIAPNKKGIPCMVCIQNLVHLPEGKEQSIRYKMATGAAKVAMAAVKDPNDQFGKIQALMGVMSGIGPKIIEKLAGADMALMETIGAFFLML